MGVALLTRRELGRIAVLPKPLDGEPGVARARSGPREWGALRSPSGDHVYESTAEDGAFEREGFEDSGAFDFYATNEGTYHICFSNTGDEVCPPPPATLSLSTLLNIRTVKDPVAKGPWAP